MWAVRAGQSYRGERVQAEVPVPLRERCENTGRPGRAGPVCYQKQDPESDPRK